MPILDLQRRLAEVGRIRLGKQVESRSGKKHPAALDTFRLTSRDKARIDEAAQLYGGTVTKWEGPSGLPEWEVITKADRLAVIVPPSAMAFSQNYELWSGGGCKRRCDGTTEFITGEPCPCEVAMAEGLARQCEPHTRLSVMMKDLKGLGVWRVDTTGWYAALEIKGQVETLEFFAGQGTPLPAVLRLDHRVIKREGETVKRFVVPVLDVDVSPGELLMGTVAVAPAKTQPALTPVPDNGSAPSSIADQVAASESIPSRRRATTPVIKATGLPPRTAAQRRSTPDPWPAVDEDRTTRSDDYEQGAGQEVEREYTRATDRGPETVTMTEQELEAQEQRQSEQEGYDAIDRAREAAEMTQDQPRMITHGQLTALGTILSKKGYTDRSDAGVKARLDFCMGLVRQLLPDSPWSSRSITTSKAFTFEEASALINHFKREEAKANQPAQQQEPDPEPESSEQPVSETSQQPVDEQADESGYDGNDEEYYNALEQEASQTADDESDDREPDADQLSML